MGIMVRPILNVAHHKIWPQHHAVLALLGRMELLVVRDGRFVPVWGTADWLVLERAAQEALVDEIGIAQAAERLGLRYVPDVARAAWLRQHYCSTGHVAGQAQEAIRLELTAQGGALTPLTAEPWLRWQLLQLGEVDDRRQAWHISLALAGKMGMVVGSSNGRGATPPSSIIYGFHCNN